MHKQLSVVLGLIVATMLTASQCPVFGTEDDAGSSGDGGRSDGGSHVNPGTIADLCAAMNRCSDLWGTSITPTRCAQYLESMFECPPTFRMVNQTYELQFEFDDSEVATCLQHLNSLDCEAFGWGSPMSEQCSKMFKIANASQAGESCESSIGQMVICQTDLECVPSDTDGVCSVCMAGVELNGVCGNNSRDCATGLYCTTSNVCAALKDISATCAADEECKSSYCHNQVCTIPPAKNQACGDNQRCGGSLRCIGGTCVDGKGENETCASEAECQDSLACSNQKCTYLDYCSKPAVGQACLFQCADGAYCSYSTGDVQVCAAYVALNQACTSSDRCVPGAYCNSTSHTCQEFADIGAACGTAGAQCDPFVAHCDYLANPMQCQALEANGQGCTNGFECASWYCDSSTDLCADETCTMP